ncbi:MAG: hypothetical protein ABWZ82_01500 [Candidatus Limnocylindrales bacterium]
MQRVTRRSGLLAAIMVAPLIAGCSALGLPEDPASVGFPGAADVVDPAATPAPVPSPVQLSSNDGYSLTLPAGWVGSRTNNEDTRAVLEAITGSDLLLGTEASDLYERTDADLSMVAADAAGVGLVPVPSVMAILVISSRRGSDDTEQRVEDILANLATVTSEVERTVTSVRAGDAQRYDLTVAGDLVAVQLRAYLFTVGDDGFVVLFGSDPALAASAAPDMEAIVKSLRFGV